MQMSILNTPQSIYDATIVHFPTAYLKTHVNSAGTVAIKIILGTNLPEIQLNEVIYKEIFEIRLQKIKVLHCLNASYLPSIVDCDGFSKKQPITEWKQFNRLAYKSNGGRYCDLIIDYLNNPTESAEQKLLDVGLAPSQICKEGYLLPDTDLTYFRHSLDKDLKLSVKMQAKFPGILEKIQDKAIEEDLRNRPITHYDKILEILRARVLGQEMATSVVASALSSQKSNQDENHNFLFVGLTGTGKTELAKTISTTKKAFISFKMNQYTSEFDTTRFFGPPTGILGCDRKPDFAIELDRCKPISGGFSKGKEIVIIKNVVLLFDELEKAHIKTRQSFLTLFDEGIVDINYTNNESILKPSKGVKIEYRLKSCILIATSNLFQQHICKAFQKKMTSEEIAEGFAEVNVAFPSENNYSAEFLGRLTITPFGPIPKGIIYQNILKLKMNAFLKEFKSEMYCHAICIKEGNEELFYQALEDFLHCNTSDIRKVPKFCKKIKRIVNENRALYGNITNKKFTLYSENRQILLKLEMFSYGTYRELPLPPTLIQK
jgi:DNA polymerase III delta prime subunit